MRKAPKPHWLRLIRLSGSNAENHLYIRVGASQGGPIWKKGVRENSGNCHYSSSPFAHSFLHRPSLNELQTSCLRQGITLSRQIWLRDRPARPSDAWTVCWVRPIQWTIRFVRRSQADLPSMKLAMRPQNLGVESEYQISANDFFEVIASL